MSELAFSHPNKVSTGNTVIVVKSLAATRREWEIVAWDLLVLSRFTKYNGLLATFAGLWSSLLAGTVKSESHGTWLPASYVLWKTTLVFLSSYSFCGAGMVWNDWIDRDIDAGVERTKNRPLVSKRVTTTTALLWAILQSMVSYGILHEALEGKDVGKHFLPAMVLSMLYPFGKRSLCRKLRIYPQYILGAVLAWPAVPGWAAIHKSQTFASTCATCTPLLGVMFFWTLYFNTAYSYQDVVGDRQQGVHSLYNAWGDAHIKRLLIAFVVPVVACLLYFFVLLRANAWLWVSWLGVWSVTFVWQIRRFDAKKPETGGMVHRSNAALGVWAVGVCFFELLLSGQ